MKNAGVKRMKKYLMGLPAITVASIALPCLIFESVRWLNLHDHNRIPYIVYDMALYVMFSIYAISAGHFRGEKSWHKFVIPLVVFVVQVAVFLMLFDILPATDTAWYWSL